MSMFSPEGRPDTDIPGWERRDGFWYMLGTGKGPFPDGHRTTDPRTIERLDAIADGEERP